MSNLGVGVMLHKLMGNDGGAIFQAAIGKTITSLVLDAGENSAADMLRFTFEDGSKIAIYDAGQSCCEHRYMHTDDDLAYHVGAQLVSGELRDGPEVSGEYGEYTECQFLLITTSRGVFTIANYNAHNGYYGGFAVIVIDDNQ